MGLQFAPCASQESHWKLVAPAQFAVPALTVSVWPTRAGRPPMVGGESTDGVGMRPQLDLKSFIVVNCLGVPDPLGSTVKSGNWPPLCVRSKTIVEPSGEKAGSSSCSLAAGDVTVWR